MWPLIKDFFTVKSAAVRAIRVALVTLGTAQAAGQLPFPTGWEWVGYVIAALGAAITGREPKEQPE